MPVMSETVMDGVSSDWTLKKRRLGAGACPTVRKITVASGMKATLQLLKDEMVASVNFPSGTAPPQRLPGHARLEAAPS